MSSAPRPSGGPPRDAPEPAGDGVVWHSTCGYAECVEPSRYAADSTCKGCRRTKYCTRECQKADRKRHKPACKADASADEAAAREGALVALPRARPPPPKPELLIKAAEEGNLKHVEALLRLGADVNAHFDGCTSLYVASSNGHVAVVSALLGWPGVNVNAAAEIGATPLYAASQNGHAAVVALLLAAPGVDVNARMNGVRPLIAASTMGHMDVVFALLAAPGVSVNGALAADGETLLHEAARSGDAVFVSALLACPTTNVNPRTATVIKGIPAGATPLRFARARGHHAVAALLEARGGVE